MKNALDISLKSPFYPDPFMDCIINGDGKEIGDPQQILSEVYSFYEKLFEDKNIKKW